MARHEDSTASSLPSRPPVAASHDGFSRGRSGECVPLVYRALRALTSPVVRAFFPLRVTGAASVPPSGPFILAANHHNYLDGVVLGVAVDRPIAFVVMPRVWQASPLHPALHRRIGSIAVNLDGPDPGAIKRVLRALEQGRGVGIFPEGARSREGRLVRGQPGVALLALRSGAPVIPAAIRGTWEALRDRRLYIPRRHPVSVRFGAPMAFGPPRTRPPGRDEREDVTRRIMGEIARLLEAEPVASRAGAS